MNLKRTQTIPLLLLLACVITGIAAPWLAANDPGGPDRDLDRVKRLLRRHWPLPPVPADPTNAVADDPRAAHLGRFLFFDKRLSRDGSVSCATCHDPARGLGDGVALGEGLGKLERHSMTLWNTAYSRWHYWDGRADTLWAQAAQPIEAANEMGSSRTKIAHLFAGDAELRRAYEAIFGPLPDLGDSTRFPADACPVDGDADDERHIAWQSMSAEDRRTIDRIYTNITKCIAAYERKLVSRDSDFDRFARDLIEGDGSGAIEYLSSPAFEGFLLFSGKANCRLCHLGPNFSDGEFHRTGVGPISGGPLRDAGRYEGIPKVLGDPYNAAGEFSDDREGAAAEELSYLSRNPDTWGRFKTPTLRNVAHTAPYMHQGQFATLDDVLHFYSTLEGAAASGHHADRTLIPLNLSDEEKARLVAFLESLSGKSIPPAWLSAPASPVFAPAPTDVTDSK